MHSQNQPERSGLGPEPKRSVYIVDDEPMLLELASLILEPLGFRVRAFRDPHQALEAFDQDPQRPWLLITDFSMHPMTGAQLMDACRKLDPGLKVMIVTGTIEEDIIQGAPTKPDCFLAKPYQARQLADLVKSLAGG